jgi:cysteine synthase
VLDASSGNTGIAFAMLGAAFGFPVHLAMPANVSPERKRILRAYGASVAPSSAPASWRGTTRIISVTWTSTPTMQTGWPTIAPLDRRSGGRLADA